MTLLASISTKLRIGYAEQTLLVVLGQAAVHTEEHSTAPPEIHSPLEELSSLTALSPLDGCYWGKVKELAPFMSEYGLIFYRVLVEIKWLLKLSQIHEIIEVPSFSEDAKSFLQGLIDGFSVNDALEIKNIEKVTNHDVKAVEYFLKQKCQSNAEVAKVLEFFHFACTSENINNLAHALMLKEAMDSVMFPVMDDIIQALCNMAKDNVAVPMLSRTHGQIYFKIRQVELDKIVDVVFELLDQAPDPAIKKSSVMPRAINMHSMLLRSH
ncbi:hypothetical protein RIF29_24348 [Crotalaria pallida]|uniref:Fumarate lyase N-terminal domain-containing protein n=1 Tax=Crotalaria pallida TaxID=3830 RepID=A0AAN9EK87_CROPI